MSESEDQTSSSSYYSRHVGRHLTHNPYYSMLVKAAKILLPLIALGIAAFLFVWPLMNENPVFRRRSSPSPHESTTGLNQNKLPDDQQIEMQQPEFSGLDREGRPFTITADKVMQKDSSITSDMTLIMPVADIFLKDQTWLALHAEQGLYKQEKQNLVLEGGVRLFHDQGYVVESDYLFIDLNIGSAETDHFVHLQGPTGIIDAKAGMMLKDFGQTIVFKGPAKLILYGEKE